MVERSRITRGRSSVTWYRPETPSENGAFRSLGITPLEGPRFRSLRLGYGLPEQRSDMLHGAESPANRNYTASPTPCTPPAAGVTHPLVL